MVDTWCRLLSLPEDIILCIIKEYLHMEDVAILDCAVCTRSYREQFLKLNSLFVANERTRQQIKCVSSEIQYLRWLSRRRIRVKSLSISPKAGSLISTNEINELNDCILHDGYWWSVLENVTLNAWPCYGFVMSFIHLCKNLKSLDAYGCKLKKGESIFELLHALRRCPHLKMLVLPVPYRFGVSDHGLQAFGTGAFENLTSFSCDYMIDVTITSVKLICRHCPLITELYLKDCHALQDDSVQEIADRLGSHLVAIALTGSGHITDRVVGYLSDSCDVGVLRHVDFSYSSRLGIAAVMFVATRHQRNMRWVDFSYCESFYPDHVIDEVRRFCPDALYINLEGNRRII